MLGRYGRSSASTSRMLTPLISMMRSLPAMRGSSWPCPPSSAITCAAPRPQKHVAETAGGRADVEAIESFRGNAGPSGENMSSAPTSLKAPREA